MAFSQATVTGPTLSRSGVHLKADWSSTSPAGTLFQLYTDGVLAWWGTDRSVLLPWPRDVVEVQVGTVAAGEGATDFSASLPAGHPSRALLSWQGGYWQADDLVAFEVYSSAAPGGAVDYTTALATVAAAGNAAAPDGYGMGGYGAGGYGSAAGTYTWRSGRLAAGTWTFAVVPVDAAGNRPASPATVAFVSAAPPQPPAPFADGTRLAYTLTPAALTGYGSGGYGAGGYGGVPANPSIVLTWNASPGA